MKVNEKAPVIASSQIEVDASPETVWDLLAAVEEWPRWNPDVKSASLGGEVAEGSTFRWKSGPGTITSTFQRVERPRTLAWTGTTLGIKAVHVWHIERRDDHTLVTTEESWEGMLARILRRPFQKMLEKAVNAGPPHLKAEAERRATT